VTGRNSINTCRKKNVRILMFIVEFSKDRSSMTVFMHVIVVRPLLSVSICNHFLSVLLCIVCGNVTAYLEIPASDKFHGWEYR